MAHIEEIVRGEGFTYWDGVQIGYTGTSVLLFPNYEVLPVYIEECGSTPNFWLYSGCLPIIQVDIHSINNTSLSAAFINNQEIGLDKYKTGNLISKDREHRFEYRPVDSSNPSIVAEGFCIHEEALLIAYNRISALLLTLRCSKIKYG